MNNRFSSNIVYLWYSNQLYLPEILAQSRYRLIISLKWKCIVTIGTRAISFALSVLIQTLTPAALLWGLKFVNYFLGTLALHQEAKIHASRPYGWGCKSFFSQPISYLSVLYTSILQQLHKLNRLFHDEVQLCITWKSTGLLNERFSCFETDKRIGWDVLCLNLLCVYLEYLFWGLVV